MFPARDIELRTVAARSRESAFARIEALFSKGADVIHMPVLALQQKMMPPKAFYGAAFRLETASRYPTGLLADRLLQMGYERVETVYETGQFARRGEIVDIYSPCYSAPLRLTFFDDEIETIRHFNESTQKSEGKHMEKAVVYPADEFMLSGDMAEKIRAYLSDFEDDRVRLGRRRKK